MVAFVRGIARLWAVGVDAIVALYVVLGTPLRHDQNQN